MKEAEICGEGIDGMVQSDLLFVLHKSPGNVIHGAAGSREPGHRVSRKKESVREVKNLLPHCMTSLFFFPSRTCRVIAFPMTEIKRKLNEQIE